MKSHIKRISISLLLLSSLAIANDKFDEQQPDGVSDKKWASLKRVVQEAKLLPEPMGIGGQGSTFGSSVSVDGDRALVGGNNMAGAGAALVLEFDGMSWQEVAVLQPSDGEQDDQFGSSVSLSGDRALVGAYGDDVNGSASGSAYIFDYDGMNWSESTKLVASDGEALDEFGASVSLSGDRALVGAYLDDDNGTASGSAYVFDYDGMNWNESAKLLASDGAASDKFGISVSLSAGRVLVGAYGDDDNINNSGSAYIFDYDGKNWSESVKLVASDGEAFDEFGVSVSLSGDRAIVGAFQDDHNGGVSGSVYVYDYDGLNWSESTKLVASDGSSGDQFGWSVSLSGDRVLVGSFGDDDNGSASGSAYIFDYDGINWSESTKLVSSDGAMGDQFAKSVSLSGDRVLVGASWDDDNGDASGSAYIFDYDGMNWSESAKLVASDSATDDWFGISVSLSGDRALVGAIRDDDNGIDSGSAYVYDYDGVNWSQSVKLVASDGESDDYFGYSVSLSGDRALVGAYGDEDNGNASGSAYIFDYDGMNWSESAKLVASDGAADDWFGNSVSLSGDRALVSAFLDDDNGTDSGSVYIFDYDGMNWSESVKLVASDGATNDYFGNSVSLLGDRALVGAFLDDDNGTDSGSAYIFDYDGMNWTESDKLLPSDGATNDYFGSSVSLSGDRMLVGARLDDDGGTDSGSAYIFDYDGMNWSESAKLVASDGAAGSGLGVSVSLSGGRALVGAFWDDDNGTASGSAYIFDYDGNNWSESTKLVASDGSADDWFGISVSLSGDRALMGTLKDDDNGTDSGSAYIISDDLIYQNGFDIPETVFHEALGNK